ncbi:MAG: Gfo/Idh/MocA family oxidoreductase [Planctomycetes bacterium]|nr:Gfo/Idh/MocA family oxidoreductase [Planctomycetota bacterium]
MTQSNDAPVTNRRQFLQRSSCAAAGAAVLGLSVPAVHAAEDNTIRLSLIGCGGRGNGAVGNALNTEDQGPIKLYAMADLDPKRMETSCKTLSRKFEGQVDVAEDRKFVGFDAYKKAIDVLRPGDVAMCTTRAYIRPLHVEYAVSKGINVFMEKPFSPDPKGLKRMLRAGQEAEKKGVKIAAGLQCRHSPARAALIDKINSGEMGELSYIRANRLTGRRGMVNMGEKSNDLLQQLQFGKINLLWVGSGHMVDNLIHQIDECCWLMDSWPVSCHGMGGREVGSDDHGQNIDTYSMEFTFPNGKKAFCGFRRAHKGFNDFATFVHCTKKAGQFSGKVHKATVHMFKDQRISEDNIAWSPTPDAQSPWDYEWIAFIDSIRNDKPHNEAMRAVYADYASLMGRAAAHANRIVTWDEITSSEFQFCDYLDDLTCDSPPPVTADEEGYFPAPVAGEWKEL